MTRALASATADERAAFIGGTPRTGLVGRSGVVWVEGPDARSFLQGLLSNDIDGLRVGASIPALLLNAQGHLEAMVQVHRDNDDAFTLVTGIDQAAIVADRLTGLQHSEALDVFGPEVADTVTVHGPLVADGVVAFDGPIPGTRTVLADDAEATLAALEADRGAPGLLEVLRVEHGVPLVGVDTGEGTLVHEAGLQDRAVSFTKGCYLGQETVARTEHRGRVNRVLRGLRGSTAPTPGAEVRLDGRVVGTIGSAAISPVFGPIALTILRREAEPGATVDVWDGGTALVCELPFR
ncbi:MAG: folate-binding protein YgfZ [Actinobacteria bacterium]|nr:folate-binding protein YgfZ [Actinomycetota bacterium]